MTKPQIIQIARLSADCDAALAGAFPVHPLWNETDRAAFLAEHGARFAGAVTNARFGADAALIDALPNLKVISSRGVGYETIDVSHAARRGIQVSNTPNVLNDCVADLAFGALIALARQFCAADRFVRRGDWLSGRFPMTTRVSGKRLGILGLGSIGRVIAQRASGFDMDVRYHNRRKVTGVSYQYEPSPAALASWADFLIVAVSGGPQSRHLISRDVLDALGPQGYLINVCRGTVVDEPTLVEALVEKRIAGAALDVFENEPHVPAALFALDNVVLFPHMSSGTNETFKAMEDLVLANLHSFFENGNVLTPIDPAIT